jgi:hypothetical protein
MQIVESNTKTTYNKTVKITRDDILELVHSKMGGQIGIDITKDLQRNDKVDVFVQVPGGGDWSNTVLEITGDTPIVVNVQYTVENNL